MKANAPKRKVFQDAMYRALGSMQQVMQENSWSEFSKIITKCFLPISPVI